MKDKWILINDTDDELPETWGRRLDTDISGRTCGRGRWRLPRAQTLRCTQCLLLSNSLNTGPRVRGANFCFAPGKTSPSLKGVVRNRKWRYGAGWIRLPVWNHKMHSLAFTNSFTKRLTLVSVEVRNWKKKKKTEQGWDQRWQCPGLIPWFGCYP